jgi:hypothetical protein
MRLLERMLPCLLATAAASALWGASETPDREAILVARVRTVMGEMLHRLPDYTCVETIERSARNPSQTKFRLLDRVRVEVAYFKGSELYAWPGAPKLEERDLAEMVGGEGAIGTGDFALHLMAVYRGLAALRFAGDDTMRGRAALKFTQTVPIALSNYMVYAPPVKGVVGYEVTAWHDAQSLDLLRFELRVTEFPAGMPIRKVFKAIEYQDVTVGGSGFSLPAVTELSMLRDTGLEGRTLSTFAHCRQYLGESTITYGDPEPAAGEQEAARTSAKLPAGVKVPLKLDREIELTTAARGDLLEMSVSREVVHNGRTVLAKGTKVAARIEGLFCGTAPYANCFVLLKTETYEDAARTGPFSGLLETPSLEHQLTESRNGITHVRSVSIPDEVEHAANDAGILFAAPSTKLPRGYPMIWRTLEVPGGSTP